MSQAYFSQPLHLILHSLKKKNCIRVKAVNKQTLQECRAELHCCISTLERSPASEVVNLFQKLQFCLVLYTKFSELV